ncbi:hypothetical protein K466DRAFT_216783 [Polyporus arcularius HHB13444]|uniref:Uncharacterized protein n=1 Tax=Polyporus arcularius HHB13444 TaxID=1314778 RepID=A0A5C3P7W4_9APHY|nr:hypothetical protein K466DRAFT_216783 [Polyporus arcularius HHB13444]
MRRQPQPPCSSSNGPCPEGCRAISHPGYRKGSPGQCCIAIPPTELFCGTEDLTRTAAGARAGVGRLIGLDVGKSPVRERSRARYNHCMMHSQHPARGATWRPGRYAIYKHLYVRDPLGIHRDRVSAASGAHGVHACRYCGATFISYRTIGERKTQGVLGESSKPRPPKWGTQRTM